MGKILIHKIKLLLLAVGAILLTLTSCNTSGCTDNRSAIPLAEFYSSSSGQVIALDSLQIHGIGAPGDSMLVTPGDKISRVYLPMHATANTTSWCISYKWKNLDFPELNDTISLDYQAEPWFASDDCGVMYRYNVDRCSYTDHLIDSVSIATPLITNLDQVAINIYFRVDAEVSQSTSGKIIKL